ncbi:MAG TPA: beta-propeller domain-containing protein [Candidatus Deferrimicrobium sp.]|nr:beta-propeller domain-containing protein [Candidatus Deferrimicrobium sp.]
MKKLFTLLALVLSSVVIIAIWNTSNTSSDLVQRPASQTVQTLKLPTVDSSDKLYALITEAQKNGSVTRGIATGMYGGAKSQALSADSSISKNAVSDYSQTNIQVQGVDEADIVKNDGSYVYQVNGQKVLIIQAQPAENLKVVNRLSFEQGFIPRDLYVADNKLVVIGGTNSFRKPQSALPQPSLGGAVADIAIAPGSGAVCAMVYDLSDKSNPKQLRRVELAGNYLTSRKIGSTLYLIANKYADIYRIMNHQPENPEYKDSVLGDKPLTIDYTKISYFPDSVEGNYLLIGALDLNSTKEMQVSSYLGGGQNIYSSPTNLYVAVTQYEKLKPAPQENSSKALILPEVHTAVYRFNLEQGEAKLSTKGDIPGTILNQYSMDEAEGYFRIATTNDDRQANTVVPKNNLYILDSALKMTGKLENLAPGERIYSARFIGNRGYLVTFKTVDPLFVVDLANPKEPKVLGSLKIPGFSTYLHPYSETELIGFGQDTTEVKDSKGNVRARVGGIKLSLFDVSDVSNPREKFREVIGDQGTYSDLLHNPKALLFSKEKNIMAFPVSVAERPKQSTKKAEQIGIPFQGAYVYSIDPVKGFVLKGRVTHLTEQDYRNKTNNWDSYVNLLIERAMYIGDTLYTLSKEQIKANELASLKELKSISLK